MRKENRRIKSRGMSPQHEYVYKRDRNDHTGIRVKSLKGNGQRKINPAAAVSKSARNMVKCDFSKRDSFIHCWRRNRTSFGKDCADGIVDADVTTGVEVFKTVRTITGGVTLLLKVLGSDFVFDSIAGGDCVLREKMHSSNHIYIPT